MRTAEADHPLSTGIYADFGHIRTVFLNHLANFGLYHPHRVRARSQIGCESKDKARLSRIQSMKNNMPMGARCSHFISAVLAILITGTVMGADERGLSPSAATRVESGAAEQTSEIVRVKRAGTVVALFVKAGDTVKKGQVMGHTELDQAKLNMDTAATNLNAEGALNQMYWQHQAMIHSRADAETNARKRLISESRLQQAISMEKWAEGQYQVQKDLKKVQKIHYNHYKSEYDSRIFRAPFDGVVKEVKVTLAQSVGLAYHAFTITNDTYWSVPVSLSESSAKAAVQAGRIPLRAKSGGATIWGTVAGVSDQFTAAGMSKIVRLLVDKNDLKGHQAKVVPQDLKFDIIVPAVKGA